jgi:hypothetical protein
MAGAAVLLVLSCAFVGDAFLAVHSKLPVLSRLAHSPRATAFIPIRTEKGLVLFAEGEEQGPSPKPLKPKAR